MMNAAAAAAAAAATNNNGDSASSQSDSFATFNNFHNSMMSAFFTAAAAQSPSGGANPSPAALFASATKRLQSSIMNMPSPSSTNLGSVGSANSNNSSSGPTSVDVPPGSNNSSGGGSTSCTTNINISGASNYYPVPGSAAACAAAAHLLAQLSPQTAATPLSSGAASSKERPVGASAAATAAAVAAGYEAAMSMIRSPCQPMCPSTPDLGSSSASSFPQNPNSSMHASESWSGGVANFGGAPLSSNCNHQPQFSVPQHPTTSQQQQQFEAAFAALQAGYFQQQQQGNANSTGNQQGGHQNRSLSTAQPITNPASNVFKSRDSSGGFISQAQAPPSSGRPIDLAPQQQTSAGSSGVNSHYGDKGLPQVPKCSICAADSTGIHFGVEACAACSAFFRRTVVLNKKYGCAKDGRCDFHKDSPTGQKCRACRFRKCLDVGMDTSAVQHRRDAIGKYSSASLVKRECTTPLNECVPSTSTIMENNQPMFSPLMPKSPRISLQGYSNSCMLPAAPIIPTAAFTAPSQNSVLEEICERYDEMNKRRKIFYCKESICSLFDDSVELEPSELSNFGECMYQFWRVEPRLVVEFIAGNRYLRALPFTEKSKIFSNFLLNFHAIEEPYITWKYGGLERKFWMMPNRIYLDFNNIDTYFDTNKSIMKDLNLDRTSAINLFLPSFQHAMDVVGEKMAFLNISKTEMVALVGIVLFDPTTQALELETQELLLRLRNQLFKDMMNFYEADDSIDYPEIRLGNLILLMAGVKIHAQKSRENMHLLKIFDVVPRDELFDDVVGIAPSSPDTVCGKVEPHPHSD